MNNLAYNSQDPDVVGPKVAELVQEETKETPKYEVELGDAKPTSVGTVVLEGLDLLLGGKQATRLFTLYFDVQAPGHMTLAIPLDRQGVGCHGGGMTFVAPLSKPVGNVTLGAPKFLGGMKFEGDQETAGKLNSNGDLMKKLKDFVRTKANLGGVDITIGQYFKIIKDGDSSAIVANNMPKPLKMGFAVSLEISAFAEIVKMIEATV